MSDTIIELLERHASSTDSDYIIIGDNDEIISQAEAEQQNEIVALNQIDSQWTLDLGSGFQRQWEEVINTLMNDTSEDHDQTMLDSLHNLVNDKIFVVSLLGNTSTGKSFLAKHLLNEFPDDPMTNGPVCIDERQKKGATTANINCYVNRSNINQKTLILDCDGEKGSAFPLLHYARRSFQHLSRTKEKAQQRRRAVSEYFPKLAYIMSNAVMIIGYDDFASTDYLTRCREFALKANDGVSQMVNRPLLILVQNTASLVQSVDYNITTERFFEIHGKEANDLRLYFSDIKCFCLTHKEQLQRTKTGILDGQELFNKQVIDLKDIFTTMRNRYVDRALTHIQWLYILRRVLPIVQSGKSVSLHTLVNEIIVCNDNQIIELSRCCFLYRYNLQSIHSPAWFNDCSRFAIRVLAHCLAVQVYGQRELVSERVIYEICEKTLEKLSDKLEEFQPCEALYTGKGRSSKNNDNEYSIYCYQHKGIHEESHRTCISVYGLVSWKHYFGWSSTDVWRGEFLSSTEGKLEGTIFSEDISNDLSCLVKELIDAFTQDPQEAKYYMFIHLLLNNQFSEEPLTIFNRICFCRSNDLLGEIEHRKERSRSNTINLMRNLFLTPFSSRSNTKNLAVCENCYQKLSAVWNRFSLEPTILTEQKQSTPVCAICLDNQRDFLFTPCGHRCVCENCADQILEKQLHCPICRASITAKQRVYDV